VIKAPSNLVSPLLLALACLSITMAWSGDLQKARDCDMAGDKVCAYREVFDYVKEHPERPIIEPMFGRPNRLGTLLEVNLILAAPLMKPEEVLVETDRMLELIASRSQHTAIRQSFMPYYLLKAEACEQQKDETCVKANANAICALWDEGFYSWPSHRWVNQPSTGKERVHRQRLQCDTPATTPTS
jgi:hypothetical protein